MGSVSVMFPSLGPRWVFSFFNLERGRGRAPTAVLVNSKKHAFPGAVFEAPQRSQVQDTLMMLSLRVPSLFYHCLENSDGVGAAD